MPPYTYCGPVDCTARPNLEVLKGRSIVVTGGANGLGEGYVRTFSRHGAYVTFGDIDEPKGISLAGETGSNFIRCNTTEWDDQVRMFEVAKANSPHNSVDVVIANAGIGGRDHLWDLEDPQGKPHKPEFKVLEVDLIGVLYTFKLAVHYFRAQPVEPDRDRCFIFKGSLAGYLDNIGNWQYSVSKFALRGLMGTVRRSSDQQEIRVNYVGPYYVKSSIRNIEVQRRLESKGVEFAHSEDCDAAMLRIACDKTIHGRTLAVVPRGDFAHGFIDADEDDFKHNTYLQRLQNVMIGAVEKKWA